MNIKTWYSVQIDLPGKKEPVILNRLNRNQYGINMKKLWNDYILKLVEETKNERGEYFLHFTARKRKRSDSNDYILHQDGQGEDGEADQGGGIRAYQQGW